MPQFKPITRKGMAGCFVDERLSPDQLSLHVSEIAPGTRAHAPHTHAGIEAFYVLEGSGVVQVEGGPDVPVSANQAVILDPSALHGLVNTGSAPMKYLVVIARG